jgi:hypothetical protein
MTNKRAFIAVLAATIAAQTGFAAQPSDVSVYLDPT